MNAASLSELGFYLNTIQDSYSHGGYSISLTISGPAGLPFTIMVPVNKFTHSFLTAMSKLGYCYDPDDPAANPRNYEKMCKETYYALLFWFMHRILFANDVIVMNPAHGY